MLLNDDELEIVSGGNSNGYATDDEDNVIGEFELLGDEGGRRTDWPENRLP